MPWALVLRGLLLLSRGVPGVANALNAQWIQRARIFKKCIEEVDPVWNDGGNLFSIAIVYIALPKSQGGGLLKLQEYFENSIEAGLDPQCLCAGGEPSISSQPATTTVKALRPISSGGNRPELKRGKEKRPYSWNIYLQRDAKTLLATIDELF